MTTPEQNKVKLSELVVGDLYSLRTPDGDILITMAGGTCGCCVYLGRKDKYHSGLKYENSYVFFNVVENREAFLCVDDQIQGFHAVKI